MGRYTEHLTVEPECQKAIAAVTPATRIKLVPEPDNPDDPRAVKAITMDGVKVGYIERDNWLVKAMIDDKTPVASRIIEIGPAAPDSALCRIILEVLTEQDATNALARPARAAASASTRSTTVPTSSRGMGFWAPIGFLGYLATVAMFISAHSVPSKPTPSPSGSAEAVPDDLFRKAEAELAAGASGNALKIIAAGTDEETRKQNPKIASLMAKIRADFTKSFGAQEADRMIREGLLPPSPKNLGRVDMLAQARSALQEGLPARGLGIIYDNATADMLRDDSEVKSLIAEINAKLTVADAPSAAQDYAETLRTHWLPLVKGIATTPPNSAPDLWNSLSSIEDATRALEEGDKLALDADGKKSRAELRNAILIKQRSLFPVLRSAYGKITGQAMWEQDIDVRVGGPGSRDITWTGGLFAARANIASAEETAQPILRKLRFAHSRYEWARGVGDTYTYPLSSPADDAVGYWDGLAFTPVK